MSLWIEIGRLQQILDNIFTTASAVQLADNLICGFRVTHLHFKHTSSRRDNWDLWVKIHLHLSRARSPSAFLSISRRRFAALSQLLLSLSLRGVFETAEPWKGQNVPPRHTNKRSTPCRSDAQRLSRFLLERGSQRWGVKR